MKAYMISIIIPVHNEEGSISKLVHEIQKIAWHNYGKNWEVIIVDDASDDNTQKIISKLGRVHVIRLLTQQGQSIALQRGVKKSIGDVIVTIDGDGQNDPRDIPKMVQKLQQGYDVVCGWRYDRQDSYNRRFSSRIAQIARKIVLSDSTQDAGCGLKVFKRKCFENFPIQSGYHRFLPWVMRRRGYKTIDVKVAHNTRKSGTSKYGIKRYINGLVDLLIIRCRFR